MGGARRGAYANGERPRLAVERLEDATPALRARAAAAGAGARAWHVRGFGDFWQHMLVAEGAAEAAIDAPGLAIWDWAPMKMLVEEAGGRYEESAAWNGRIDVSELR